jgi:hypothetical protein
VGSVFGEDALVNVSVEATAEGKLMGYIRIRSKTQVGPGGAADPPLQNVIGLSIGG